MKKNKTWDLTDTQTVEVIGGDMENRIENLEKSSACECSVKIERLEKTIKELQNKLEAIVFSR